VQCHAFESQESARIFAGALLEIARSRRFADRVVGRGGRCDSIVIGVSDDDDSRVVQGLTVNCNQSQQ
jgi:hypothetical protein